MNEQTEQIEPPIRMFQIKEHDLAELERQLPRIVEAAMVSQMYGPTMRKRIRDVQTIITNVRWDYGPWGSVEVIPA